MRRKEIREQGGRLLAYYSTDAAGRAVVHDANGRTYGVFDSKSGFTQRVDGKTVGRGDTTASLVPPRKR